MTPGWLFSCDILCLCSEGRWFSRLVLRGAKPEVPLAVHQPCVGVAVAHSDMCYHGQKMTFSAHAML